MRFLKHFGDDFETIYSRGIKNIKIFQKLSHFLKIDDIYLVEGKI